MNISTAPKNTDLTLVCHSPLARQYKVIKPQSKSTSSERGKLPEDATVEEQLKVNSLAHGNKYYDHKCGKRLEREVRWLGAGQVQKEFPEPYGKCRKSRESRCQN